ncbi:Golgi transport complex subunit 6 [Myotisia sp. PD_48]|nr:Golgi transport complex subunit 6 [Myotisia sp. PD_48]
MTSYFPDGAVSSASRNGTDFLAASDAGAPRQTALSNRLNSVLSASYADSDIRNALQTLDDRKILNTAETRRALRLDVQKDVIESNGKIIQDFGKVAAQLSRIGNVIASLNTICEDMRKHMSLAHEETGPVLDEALTLMTQKDEAETKQKLLDAFHMHFILSEEDKKSLTSLAGPVDDRFFGVLARTKQIHKDCEVLLGGENQRLGLEVMEQSSKDLNAAFLKLYKWIQNEFKSLNLEDPQINNSIRRGLRVLAERPSLFHNCLDHFSEAREYILSDAFHHALTATTSVEGSDKTTKPIEFSAHDPLRYVGDVLAWVHSATVSEREALETLFVSEGEDLAKGIEAGIKSEPWSRMDEDEASFDGQKALTELVTRDLAGVSRSLRQRVELVIRSHDDPVTVYKVMNLLAFYESTFHKLVGPDSSLVETLVTLQEFTMGHFHSLTQDHFGGISGDPAGMTPPEDFSIPEYLSECLETISSLMKAYDSSFGHETLDQTDSNENKFTPILRASLDPFLNLAKASASGISNPDMKVMFQTNCLLAVRSTISSFHFASATHLAPLSSTLAELRTELHRIQHNFLLHKSGLQVLLQALEPYVNKSTTNNSIGEGLMTPSGPNAYSDLATIRSLPEFQPSSLSAISQQLDDFLPSALVDATDNLKLIQSPSLVKGVTEEAVEDFARDFEFVESMILGADEASGKVYIERNGESERVFSSEEGEDEEDEENWSLRALFPRTTGEIRVLLS